MQPLVANLAAREKNPAYRSRVFRSHLAPIRTAHHTAEHVQRARGIHPGRPFADHARDALALIRSLPDADHDDGILTRMRLIVDFHERSIAGQGLSTDDVAV